MKTKKSYQLFTSQTQKTLFEGEFTSFTDCLENAVKRRVNLSNIDLSHRNLSNANLDDAIMPNADFTGANLNGTNLSESYLKGSNFNNASLYNTCLCYSNLTGCNFENAAFGATDINGAIITRCRFSTLSCFSLNFHSVQSMYECVFISPNSPPSIMSQPPIVINGLQQTPVLITDNHIKSGHILLNSAEASALSKSISTKIQGQNAGHNQKDNKFLTR